MSASPARRAALDVITRVREREAYAHETMSAVLDESGLHPRDAAFATRLAYGTISCRGTLDEAIGRFVDQKHSLESRVSDALALSAYELLFARTPARAAVTEGVELVRDVRPKATRLANAVLRRLSEGAAGFPWGDPDTDDAALARLHGHPAWMAELLVSELGRPRAVSMMASDNEPAPLYLAHLPHQVAFEQVMDELARAGADPHECPVAGCIRADVPSAAVRSRALSGKRVIVADAAAQFAAACVRPRAGWRLFDVGAGRGTKTLILSGLARLNGGTASIVAVDTHKFKLDALMASAAEIGAREISALVADASDIAGALAAHRGTADAVLVDAPCSGLGTLRRHPDRRWRAAPGEIEALAGLGSALLRASAALVKPGGFVVYSTCTITRRENDDVVSEFLSSEEGQGFAIDSLEAEVPEEWREFLGDEGWFRSLPSTGGPDGHFVVRFRRGSE